MTDVVVIGGGIAGVSVAAELADRADVVLVEQESVLAYHTTGRSAAMYFESYGHPASRPLTRASRPFFEDPPEGTTDAPLLSPRRALYIGRPDQADSLAEKVAGDATRDFVEVSGADVPKLQPVIRPGYAVSGLLDPVAQDIDVAAVHQAFVRLFRARGGTIDTSAPAVDLDRRGDRWVVRTKDRRIEANAVVNAAGAWGDVIAAMAGLPPVGLVPRRRTAFMVSGSDDYADTPLVADVDMQFYFKPDGEQFLCSLAEEVPEEPCDARPREIDVALAIDRINAATILDIRHVRSSWTGQRTFAPDEAPVIGFDPLADGFFWLVGQGGTGIQSSPGAARYSASMILDGEADPMTRSEDVDPVALSPTRFR